ncbi:MAG: endo,4-beta-xylanase precursor [Cellvibrio sp.]|nr:endo,4-beta-xylanase precursor [Cellvibrio sp.]
MLKINCILPLVLSIFFTASAFAATLLEHVEAESGTLLAGYTSAISSPFAGVAAYGNGDGVEIATAKLSNAPGIFQIAVRGASTNTSAAGIAVYVGDSKVGSVAFAGVAASTQLLQFKLSSVPALAKIKLVLESDTGANDTYLDWYELTYVAALPPTPAAPVLPATGAYFSGQYRNLFVEAGYSKADVDAKMAAAYNQLFHSAQTDRTSGQAIFITDPSDSSRAYIWDTGNNDVRSEGMSYGMMIALQMNRQDDFNKLWAWANRYMLNTSGEMKGYFGWQKNTDGSNRDTNPAPDGEEYFVTSLFLASNRWGDGTGIYNYKAEANKLLDNMYANGQMHYVNGQQVSFSLFDKTANQILFSPYGNQFTDPSYHLPAFYELWARWATNNKPYWAQLAVNSRAFWKKAVTAKGLNPDYANFDGTVVSSASADHQILAYDAWRTAGNAGLDFAWFAGDAWETTYATSLHSFLKTQGTKYPSLYKLDGTVYNNNADHSPGFVAQNAMAGLASNNQDVWDFVNDLWDTPVPAGQYRYYDGSLYLFGMLAVSGNYKIYCPGGVVCNGDSQSSSLASVVSSNSIASSRSSAISPISSSRSSTVSLISSSKSSSASSVVSSRSSSVSSAASSSSSTAATVISAFTQIEAENYNAASGSGITKLTADGGTVINFSTASDWIGIANVDFGSAGPGNIAIRATDPGYGANIQVRLDSPTGVQIATVYPNGGGVYQVKSNSIYPTPAGVHTVYLKVTSNNVKINWIKFSQ